MDLKQEMNDLKDAMTRNVEERGSIRKEYYAAYNQYNRETQAALRKKWYQKHRFYEEEYKVTDIECDVNNHDNINDLKIKFTVHDDDVYMHITGVRNKTCYVKSFKYGHFEGRNNLPNGKIAAFVDAVLKNKNEAYEALRLHKDGDPDDDCDDYYLPSIDDE